MTKRESIFWTVLLAVWFACVIMAVDGTFAPEPSEPHHTPTLSFDVVFDPTVSSGVYRNADGEWTLSCNGKDATWKDELTREDLRALNDFIITRDLGKYFEALCLAPPPFGSDQSIRIPFVGEFEAGKAPTNGIIYSGEIPFTDKEHQKELKEATPPPIRFLPADCQTGIWTDEQMEWMKGKTCEEIEALGGVPARWLWYEENIKEIREEMLCRTI